MSGEKVGYVYVMRSEHVSGLKIGFTTNSIKNREAELNTTGLASPLRAIFYILVENPFKVEQSVHEKLANYRISENREFFNCSEDIAIKKINEVVKELDLKIHDIFSYKNNEEIYSVELNWPEKAQSEVKNIITNQENLIQKKEITYNSLLNYYPKNPDDLILMTRWLMDFQSLDVSFVEYHELSCSISNLKSLCKNLSDFEFDAKRDEFLAYMHKNLLQKLWAHKAKQLAISGFKKLSQEIEKFILEFKKNNEFLDFQIQLNALENDIYNLNIKLLYELNEIPNIIEEKNLIKFLQEKKSVLSGKHKKEIFTTIEKFSERINFLERQTTEGGSLFYEIENFMRKLGFNDLPNKYISEKLRNQLFGLNYGSTDDPLDIFSFLEESLNKIYRTAELIYEKSINL